LDHTELPEVGPAFKSPADFATAVRFGSREIRSSEPISITALRLTVNQRGDLLLTTTPVADLTLSANSEPLNYPQFAVGAGYTAGIILMNTSDVLETGTVNLSRDDGSR
jgi:hypothetical protein